MKTIVSILFLIFSLMIGMNAFSQKFSLNSTVDTQSVKINGKTYQISASSSFIKTNYPKFDTLTFIADSEYSENFIICNFKPDSSYTITMACCMSLDIIPTSKLKHDSLRFWDPETDLEKIHKQLADKPFISIRTLQKSEDSIYAWHADAACMTEWKVIGKRLWRLGVPPKCFYWNNITHIQFFKTDKTMPKHKETDLESFLSINNIVELADISFRLFDDQRFVIVFDEENNTVTLMYE